MILMEELAEKIAKSFGYPINDVREGILASSDKSIDSVIAYCESKKEKPDGKEKTSNE